MTYNKPDYTLIHSANPQSRPVGIMLSVRLSVRPHIVPNFKEIWPSKAKTEEYDPAKGVNYVMRAMYEGVPGNRNGVFTTVGKPKVTRQVSSMIHSARPTVSPGVDIVFRLKFVLFC